MTKFALCSIFVYFALLVFFQLNAIAYEHLLFFYVAWVIPLTCLSALASSVYSIYILLVKKRKIQYLIILFLNIGYIVTIYSMIFH